MQSSIFVGTAAKVDNKTFIKAKHYIDMIIERDYADEMKGSSVDSGVDISYEGLSINFPEGSENDKTEDEIKVSYEV